MGGRALKNTFTRRYDKQEFLDLEKEITPILEDKFGTVHVTTCFDSKESFGDMDVLVKNLGFNDIEEFIQDTFNPTEIINNSGVYSFDYKELQIDLIFIPVIDWDVAKVYFSYNDLHNFIGKIARKFGTKWGFDGLKWIGFDGSRKIGKVVLTKDYKVALEFLGFDVDRYDRGFNNLQEIYDYVIDSEFFDPSFFDLENFNANDKRREKKRTNFVEFLKYIKESTADLTNKHTFFGDKNFYIGHINLHFPDFYQEYKNMFNNHNRSIKIKNIFNGHVIMDFFKSKRDKIEGRELGDLIDQFKDTFKNDDLYNLYILSTLQFEILETFYTFVKEKRESK